MQTQTTKPEWIVNDLGELGVKINGEFFFLYKGDSLQYGEKGDAKAKHDNGEVMKYRTVGKREFGETCWPLAWTIAGMREARYTADLAFIEGLSDGSPADGQWQDLPAPKAEDAQGDPTVFPQTLQAGDLAQTFGGLTLRDYFAAKVMQALMQYTFQEPDVRASRAYEMADAMLLARNQTTE